MASTQRTFDFMRRRKLAYFFSSILVLGSAAALVTNGLKFGIDFTGGTLVELGYTENADLD
ncbi:MAG: protein translocase subunit SecF, partial [Gammaproteobacteria bacterium]|nr:protein translocase subunit SecF [Gammaproteobacteria bacterium]